MPQSIRQLWLRWKALRLPWRRQWLCGVDLAGNTYWEFKNAINAGRARRIVRSKWKTYHSDVNVSPSWMQWLRHTRADPPTIAEQQLDQLRQVQLKRLAAEADRRWAEKDSFLQSPKDNASTMSPEARKLAGELRRPQAQDDHSSSGTVDAAGESRIDSKVQQTKQRSPKPWQSQQVGQGQDAQPDSWTPTTTRRREVREHPL